MLADPGAVAGEHSEVTRFLVPLRLGPVGHQGVEIEAVTKKSSNCHFSVPNFRDSRR